MGLTLSYPGDFSDWLALDEAVRFFAAEPDDKATDEERDKAAKDVNDAAAGMAGVAVRVTVLSRAKYLELVGGSEGISEAKGFGAVLKSEAHNESVMRAGLAAIRGIDGGDPDGVDDKLVEALAAAGLSWLIASTVLRYNGLKPAERQAFFTLAAAA